MSWRCCRICRGAVHPVTLRPGKNRSRQRPGCMIVMPARRRQAFGGPAAVTGVGLLAGLLPAGCTSPSPAQHQPGAHLRAGPQRRSRRPAGRAAWMSAPRTRVRAIPVGGSPRRSGRMTLRATPTMSAHGLGPWCGCSCRPRRPGSGSARCGSAGTAARWRAWSGRRRRSGGRGSQPLWWRRTAWWSRGGGRAFLWFVRSGSGRHRAPVIAGCSWRVRRSRGCTGLPWR